MSRQPLTAGLVGRAFEVGERQPFRDDLHCRAVGASRPPWRGTGTTPCGEPAAAGSKTAGRRHPTQAIGGELPRGYRRR